VNPLDLHPALFVFLLLILLALVAIIVLGRYHLDVKSKLVDVHLSPADTRPSLPHEKSHDRQ
jgi:hypothetical protein